MKKDNYSSLSLTKAQTFSKSSTPRKLLPVTPDIANSSTTKDYYADIFDNEKRNFSYSTNQKMLLRKLFLA